MGKTASDLRKDGWPPDEMQKYHPWQVAERYTEDSNAVVRRENPPYPTELAPCPPREAHHRIP